jgi:hypothetical protein
LKLLLLISRSHDSSVDITTGYGLDGRGSIAGKGKTSLLHSVQTDSGALPAWYQMGNGGTFPGSEADHSPPSRAEVKNGGAIPPLPHMYSRRGA